MTKSCDFMALSKSITIHHNFHHRQQSIELNNTTLSLCTPFAAACNMPACLFGNRISFSLQGLKTLVYIWHSLTHGLYAPIRASRPNHYYYTTIDRSIERAPVMITTLNAYSVLFLATASPSSTINNYY